MSARISKSNKLENLPVGTFGDRLRYCRVHAELTQEALGRELNVTKGSVSSYEQGNNYPHVESLPILARLFDVSLEWLLSGGTDAPAISKHELKVSTPASANLDTGTLTPLQVAARNLLTEVAEAGLLPNAECLELMMRWQERLDQQREQRGGRTA